MISNSKALLNDAYLGHALATTLSRDRNVTQTRHPNARQDHNSGPDRRRSMTSSHSTFFPIIPYQLRHRADVRVCNQIAGIAGAACASIGPPTQRMLAYCNEEEHAWTHVPAFGRRQCALLYPCSSLVCFRIAIGWNACLKHAVVPNRLT